MAAYWVFLSRTLNSVIVGDIALANAVAVPISIMIDAGFSQFLIREYRLGNDSGLPPVLKSAVRARYVMIGASVAIAAGVVVVLGESSQRAWIGLFIATSYGLDAFGMVWLTRARAELTVTPYLLIRTAQSAGVMLLIIVLWYTAFYSGIVVAAVSSVVYLASAGIALRQWITGTRWCMSLVPSESPPSGRRHFAWFAILTTTYSRLDTIIVQVILGSAFLAIYTLAFKLVEAARVIPGAIARSVLSAASATRSQDQPVQMARAIAGSVRMSVVLSMILISAGPSISLVLFGAEYAEGSATALRLLACTLPGLGLTAPLSSLLLARGQERIAARNSLWTLCATLGAAVPLGNQFGLGGVAGGVLVGELVSVGFYLKRITWLPAITPVDVILAGLGAVVVAGWLALPAISAESVGIAFVCGSIGTCVTIFSVMSNHAPGEKAKLRVVAPFN